MLKEDMYMETLVMAMIKCRRNIHMRTEPKVCLRFNFKTTLVTLSNMILLDELKFTIIVIILCSPKTFPYSCICVMFPLSVLTTYTLLVVMGWAGNIGEGEASFGI